MSENRLNQLISLIFIMRHLVLEHAKSSKFFNQVSLLQLEMLRYVSESDSPTMKDTARHFGITPPSATSLVAGLVEDGQLKRQPDPQDRRTVRLVLTAEGKKAYRQGFKDTISRMKAVLKNLNPGDQKAIIRILKKLSKSYNHNL